MSKIRAIFSELRVRTRRPSGLMAADHTLSRWPPSVAVARPVEASKMHAVLSPPAVTTYFPSGLKAAERTHFRCPFERRQGLAGTGIEDTCRLIAAGRHDALPVRAEPCGGQPCFVALEHGQELARPGVERARRLLVPVADGHHAATRPG